MASDASRARREGGPPPRPILTLAPLSQADTTLVTVQPQFLQLVADHLGDHLTDADGFDDLLNPALTSVDADTATVDDLATVAADAGFTPGAFSDSVLTPIGTDIGTFLAGGDAILTGLGVDVAPVAVTPDVATFPPSQPDSGVGGGPELLLGGDGAGIPWEWLPNVGFEEG